MTTKQTPLLCELHAHTTWSDGTLSVRELCDLYGRCGFDVVAVTDHTTRDERCVTSARHGAYLEEIAIEAERARRLYDLLVIPGVELTYDDPDPSVAAHAVAIGLHHFVGLTRGFEVALACARGSGAALVAAHPYSVETAAGTARGTGAWHARRETLSPLVDRWEMFNRDTPFGWVAEAQLPCVASGDFHRLEHLATWKTLLPCGKSEEAVVAYLRSARPAYLVRVDAAGAQVARAA